MNLSQSQFNQYRPREKLLAFGASSLSDIELLAVFLQSGVKELPVALMAKLLLTRFGSIGRLLTANQQQICQVKGVGVAKYVQLQACLELSHRYLLEPLKAGDVMENPTQVKQYLQSRLKCYPNEVFAAIFLDNQHRLLRFEELFFGTINAASVHPRVVVQKSLTYNAAALIIAHNHPSGVAEASHCDLDMTETLKKALALVDVRLLDHLIIAGHRVLSLAEQGHL